MILPPKPAALSHVIAEGAVALPAGFLWLAASRALIVADAHLGYEDVMGGALPLWSTVEATAAILVAVERMAAEEVIFLGDVIHGSSMSEGAARAVIDALDTLRARVGLTLVAGNHEGRTRGARILGETVESCERDGWLLLHGDKAGPVGSRAIIGHLHPSLHMGGGAHAPAFLASANVIVVPARTPYSSGLDVLSDDCIAALAPWNVHRRDLHVVASTNERVYPFGSLSVLRRELRAAPKRDGGSPYRRKFLRPDR
jgi:metallophosphoesterase superfamily enzyme